MRKLKIAAALAALVLLSCSRETFIFHLDDEFESLAEILKDVPGGFGIENETSSAPGIVIAAVPPEGEGDGKIRTFYRLSYELEYEDAAALACDPWLFFGKAAEPFPDLARAERAVLLPGKDEAARNAWIARSVMTAPGQFDESAWDANDASFFGNAAFVPGSQTMNWNDVLFALTGSDPLWLYAPLSKLKNLPDYRRAQLAAVPFPEPDGWTQQSLQARVLWAEPLGSAKQIKKMKKTLDWLKSPETQTKIADALGWIPASPDGAPYDPLAKDAQVAWLTSSWIYQIQIMD